MSLATAVSGKSRLLMWPWLFMWAPALMMAVGMPLAGMHYGGDRDPLFIAVPYYLGIFAAPGYLAALFASPGWLLANSPRRFWIRFSLGGSLLFAAASTSAGLVMVVFLIPALWSVIGVLLLWSLFERAGQAARGG